MKEADKSNYQISIHEGAGHLIDLPFCPPITLTKHPLFPKKMVLQCGGEDTIKHGKAQENIWMEILTFFETSLRTWNAIRKSKVFDSHLGKIMILIKIRK